MTYYQWLMKHTKQNSPLGDIASDAQLDKDFPTDVDSLPQLRAYLTFKRACDGSLRRAAISWCSYLRALKRAKKPA